MTPKEVLTLEKIFPKWSLFGPMAYNVAYSYDGKYSAYLYQPYAERRHGAPRADPSRLDPALGALVAPLELAATAAPAGVVGLEYRHLAHGDVASARPAAHAWICGRSHSRGRPGPRSRTGRGMSEYRRR